MFPLPVLLVEREGKLSVSILQWQKMVFGAELLAFSFTKFHHSYTVSMSEVVM